MNFPHRLFLEYDRVNGIGHLRVYEMGWKDGFAFPGFSFAVAKVSA